MNAVPSAAVPPDVLVQVYVLSASKGSLGFAEPSLHGCLPGVARMATLEGPYRRRMTDRVRIAEGVAMAAGALGATETRRPPLL